MNSLSTAIIAVIILEKVKGECAQKTVIVNGACKLDNNSRLMTLEIDILLLRALRVLPLQCQIY